MGAGGWQAAASGRRRVGRRRAARRRADAFSSRPCAEGQVRYGMTAMQRQDASSKCEECAMLVGGVHLSPLPACLPPLPHPHLHPPTHPTPPTLTPPPHLPHHHVHVCAQHRPPRLHALHRALVPQQQHTVRVLQAFEWGSASKGGDVGGRGPRGLASSGRVRGCLRSGAAAKEHTHTHCRTPVPAAPAHPSAHPPHPQLPNSQLPTLNPQPPHTHTRPPAPARTHPL